MLREEDAVCGVITADVSPLRLEPACAYHPGFTVNAKPLVSFTRNVAFILNGTHDTQGLLEVYIIYVFAIE